MYLIRNCRRTLFQEKARKTFATPCPEQQTQLQFWQRFFVDL